METILRKSICSICGEVYREEEVERPIGNTDEILPSHGICEGCKPAYMKQVEKELEQWHKRRKLEHLHGK